jgi:hypothetical protein
MKVPVLRELARRHFLSGTPRSRCFIGTSANHKRKAAAVKRRHVLPSDTNEHDVRMSAQVWAILPDVHVDAYGSEQDVVP